MLFRSKIFYITDKNIKDFQPMNINFGLFPPQGGRFRDERRLRVVKQAQTDFNKWLGENLPKGPS